jgi:glycerate 2-kinase
MDRVVALISGGASSLIEVPVDGTLYELRVATRAVMAAGAPIAELNTVRGALSAIKAGKLAEACGARVITFVASDVIGDPLDVIGSGPTIGPWLDAANVPVDVGAVHERRRRTALALLARYRVAPPRALDAPIASRITARDDRAQLVSPIAAFAEAACARLRTIRVLTTLVAEPLVGDVADVAERLVALPAVQPFVAYGEPTIQVPRFAGTGGRAQQLALLLARAFRGTDRSAFVAGSDGIDGPAPLDRPAPAGAYVDGTTWAAIARTRDPDAALARCDAGTALAAVGALVVTGPTGVNHADIAIIG